MYGNLHDNIIYIFSIPHHTYACIHIIFQFLYQLPLMSYFRFQLSCIFVVLVLVNNFHLSILVFKVYNAHKCKNYCVY